MRIFSLLGLLALIPAAFNPAPGKASPTGMVVPICRDGKAAGSIIVPLEPQLPPARDGEGCCVKGCHGGSSRKRLASCF